MFLTSLKQTCNEYLIKFSENQSAPRLENRKISPCSPCAPNLLQVLISRIPGYHNLCSPVCHLSGVQLFKIKVILTKQYHDTLAVENFRIDANITQRRIYDQVDQSTTCKDQTSFVGASRNHPLVPK